MPMTSPASRPDRDTSQPSQMKMRRMSRSSAPRARRVRMSSSFSMTSIDSEPRMLVAMMMTTKSRIRYTASFS